MPRARKPKQPNLTRLARLPQDADLLLVGGKVRLPIYLEGGGAVVQPWVVLWLDPATHTIRGSDLVDPRNTYDDGQTEALVALVNACAAPEPVLPLVALGQGFEQDDIAAFDPLAQPQPVRPGRVQINDAALAAAARAMLEPLGIAIEYVAELPHLDEAVAEFVTSMGGPQEGEPEAFSWNVPDDALQALFGALAGYWRRHPWQFMSEYPPVVIDLGENGPSPEVPKLFASILGGGGELVGIVFYFSAEDLEHVRERGATLPDDSISERDLDALVQFLEQVGAPVGDLSRDKVRVLAQAASQVGPPSMEELDDIMGDCLAVYFDSVKETNPQYVRWLAEHSLKYVSKQGVPTFFSRRKGEQPRQLDAREVRTLTLAVNALIGFIHIYRYTLKGHWMVPGPLTNEVPVRYLAEEVRVPVSYEVPTERWLMEIARDVIGQQEEPMLEPSLTGPTTLYRFNVALAWKPSVWRRIELRGDQTLDDLHLAIQDAFGWDNDHLYAFYLSGNAWDQRSEYTSPFAEEGRCASNYLLEHLPLQRRKKFLYIFDFGDELRHIIELEAVEKGGVEPRKKYPRVVERHGRNLPQYPIYDEE